MLNVFDSQSGGLSLIFVVIFEAVAVSWGYGRYLITMISQRCLGACLEMVFRSLVTVVEALIK